MLHNTYNKQINFSHSMHIKLYAKGGADSGYKGPEDYTILGTFLIFQLLDLWFLILFLHLLSCFVCLFTILRILCFCVCFVASPMVHSCLSPIFVQVYRPLPPSGNPTAINKYHKS